MHHIDEHILELYVLNSPKVENQRDRIDAHLLECTGCKKLVDEMSAFHQELAEELKQTPVPETTQTSALAKRKAEIEPYFEPYIPPAPSSAMVRSFEKFTLFVKRNPVTAAAGSLVFVSMLSGLLYFGFLKNKAEAPVNDLNPTYYNYNTTQNFLEVYNKENDLIWKKHTNPLLRSIDENSRHNITATYLVDLNKDGENEIITFCTMSGQNDTIGNSLLIFNVRNHQAQDIDLSRHFQYLSRNYYGFTFSATSLIIDSIDTNKELFISCCNSTRSPSYVARLNSDGNFIGRLWHFGHVTIHPLDINDDGKNELILNGVNDTPDTTLQEFGAIAVIDPAKIIDDKKSTASPGFVMPYSDAELLYIQIPHNIIDSTLKVNPNILAMKIIDTNVIHFSVNYLSKSDDGREINLDYFFTKRMEIISIRSNSVMDTFWRQQLAEGKTTTKLDERYLNSLKERIRYWDGQKWHKKWTKVKHDSVMSSQSSVDSKKLPIH